MSRTNAPSPELSYLYGNVKIETPYRLEKKIPVDDYVDNTLLTGIAVGLGYENLDKNKKNLFFVGLKYSGIFTPLNDDKDVYLHCISLELGFLLGNNPKQERER